MFLKPRVSCRCESSLEGSAKLPWRLIRPPVLSFQSAAGKEGSGSHCWGRKDDRAKRRWRKNGGIKSADESRCESQKDGARRAESAINSPDFPPIPPVNLVISLLWRVCLGVRASSLCWRCRWFPCCRCHHRRLVYSVPACVPSRLNFLSVSVPEISRLSIWVRALSEWLVTILLRGRKSFSVQLSSDSSSEGGLAFVPTG